MMRTVDRLRMRAPVEQVFQAAADVERWPVLLSHYRWVRVLERRGEVAVVEMAAWRPFGIFKYPTWWVSEMRLDPKAPAVHYRHIRGITRGMDVVWQLEPAGEDTEVTIVHEWAGPRWPLIGALAAEWIIGPVFIHGIASRTLRGIAAFVEGGKEGGRLDGREGGISQKVPRGAGPERSRRARDDVRSSTPSASSAPLGDAQ
jgi:ribosome-associated toxin RatA of RatAB toxin-antitoxin module